MFGRTLKLVALGKSTMVDSASPPLGGLALGCRDLWASRRWVFSDLRATTSLAWCLYIYETWACNLCIIEDKSVWSSTWISLFYWSFGCSIVVVLVQVLVIAIISWGWDITYTAPWWIPKCSCQKWTEHLPLCRRVFLDGSLLKSLVCASSKEQGGGGGYLQKTLQWSCKGST